MSATERQIRLDSWLTEHQGLLFKIVRAYAFTPEDRDDLIQEIALQLLRSIPRYRGEAKVSTWIYRVALYASMTWSQRERSASSEPILEPAVLEQREVEVDPRLDWLFKQIEQLDPVERSLVLLHLDGYAYSEIAELLGLSVSNVGVKLNRIKQTLTTRSRRTASHGI